MAEMTRQKERARQAQAYKGMGLSEQEAYAMAGADPVVAREYLKRKMQEPILRSSSEAMWNYLNQGQPQVSSAEPTAGQEAQGLGSLLGTQTPTAQVSPQINMPTQGIVSPDVQKAIFGAEVGRRQELMREAHKEKLTEKKFELARQGKILDTVEKELVEQNKSKEGAKEILNTVEAQRILSKTGKLDAPGFLTAVDVLEKLVPGHPDLKGLMYSPQSRSYEGLQKSYLRALPHIFGARPSAFAIEQFLKSLPQLSNTPKGQEMLFKINERVANAMLEKANIYQQTYDEFVDKGLDFKKFNRTFEKKWDERGKVLMDEFLTGFSETAGLLPEIVTVEHPVTHKLYKYNQKTKELSPA
jgi:hypothetical protein